MPSTTTQRKLASQFISVTNATKENAQQYLKNANYNLDAAVNLYFTSTEPEEYGTGSSRSGGRSREEVLNELFNSLRGVEDMGTDKEDRDTDTIGVESIGRYTQALGINMNNFEFFVLCEILQPEVLGQISRKEFVEGWKNQSESNTVPLKPSMEAHKTHIRARIQDLPKNPALFKKVYRQAFMSGKESQQKAIPKEIAIAYWDELFSPTLRSWKTAKVDWLDAWERYLADHWKRSVNKDMWNQTLEFAMRTMEDDTLNFWSEDQAWPGVIDDFVVWCREQGVVPSPKKGADGMEVDN